MWGWETPGEGETCQFVKRTIWRCPETKMDAWEWGVGLEVAMEARKEECKLQGGTGLKARLLLICAMVAVCGKIFEDGLCGEEGVLS